MMRAEYLRRLHEARVEAFAMALFDAGPVPTNNEMEQRFRAEYRQEAERRVSEYERHGLFLAGTEEAGPPGVTENLTRSRPPINCLWRTSMTLSPRLYRLKHIVERTGLARSTVYARVAEGRFPAPIALEEGSRSSAWIADEVDQWVMDRIRAARPERPATSPAA